MEALGLLMHGFAVLLTWKTLLLMMVGLVLGIFVGVLPGLGGPNGVAILLPLTFTMDPTSAIVMLSCIYWGALFGGAITSILFNIPGEAWSVATTFDGYPMAQQGKAAEALTAAFTSSFIGSLVAVMLITFLAPMISSFALKFGPPNSLRCTCSPSAPLSGSAAKPSTRPSSRCRSVCCSPASAWTPCPASSA
jgi:putative tricarboxylic transport membrane protein